MFGIENLWLFIISGLLLNISPGPDTVLIVSRSASQGWRAGLVAVAGIGTGVFVHIFAAALGVSALLATSATAFTLVKLAGAAYLVYLGVKMLLAKPAEHGVVVQQVSSASFRSIFLQGFVTNVLNPKVALFFLAFVPQFIAVDAANKALAFVILGFIFNVNGMLWCVFLAVSAGFAGKKMKVSPLVAQWLNKSMGALFVALGVKLALADQR
ncbi:LysE family translocator [Rheinheimera sediminis]|uniref:LysE family translocator n=1 Tax=Rheinheimera sp. YQF-1 TaxID=2499626 RepID=UPI000FD70E7D|nr:LysE family translocator [Rheinheimera sp. YQF-1]RVT45612.1 LysE family translocator [Rheinheimera sp. YQF-1]